MSHFLVNSTSMPLFDNATHFDEFDEFDTLEKRQKEALTDEENDLEWAGTITIGTPAQSFLIDFDSTCTSDEFCIMNSSTRFSRLFGFVGTLLELHQQYLQE